MVSFPWTKGHAFWSVLFSHASMSPQHTWILDTARILRPHLLWLFELSACLSWLLHPLGIGTHIPFRKLLPLIVHADYGLIAWVPQKAESEANGFYATISLGCAIPGTSREGRRANKWCAFKLSFNKPFKQWF